MPKDNFKIWQEMLPLPLKHSQMLHFKPQDLEHLREICRIMMATNVKYTFGSRRKGCHPPNTHTHTHTIMALSLIPRPLWVGGISQIPRRTVSIEEKICCRWSPDGNRIAQHGHPPSFWALLAVPSLRESCSQPLPVRALFRTSLPTPGTARLCRQVAFAYRVPLMFA